MRVATHLIVTAGELLRAERERWFLWVPVLIGCGIGTYFALPQEPPWWLGLVVIAPCVLLGAGMRHQTQILIVCMGVSLFMVGFAAAQLRSQAVAAPVLEKRIGPVTVTGRVVRLEAKTPGWRVTLDNLTVQRLDNVPAQVRVKLTRKPTDVLPGDRVDVRAVLMPPPEPAAPGAFQFPRYAWFKQLGGVGFAVSGLTKQPEGVDHEGGGGWEEVISGLRIKIAERIMAVLPGERGGVAAALTTGERGAIPKRVLETYRASGLAHLLSISGLHMSLVAGLVFIGMRSLLALFPSIALRYDIKKGAAGVAMCATLSYLLISGAGVPTQRAFIMTSVVLLAVILDRSAISMRVVAWAALLVLLWHPEALIGPSFQMSFAAVVALIATYEGMAERTRIWRSKGLEWWRKMSLYLGGVILTTLVASIATAPFAVFHFHRFALYGLAANLIAVPLMGLWVMPLAIAALLLMPFGWESIPLQAMGEGIGVVNWVAAEVSAWPASAVGMRAVPIEVLILLTLGGLWLCLWRGRLRFWGLVLLPLAVVVFITSRPPDILVNGNGKLVAVRGEAGALHLLKGRGDRFTKSVWAERDGRVKLADWPNGAKPPCDALGCVMVVNGKQVAVLERPEGLAEDCAKADVLISRTPVRGPVRDMCSGPELVIDRFDVYRKGAHSIRIEGGRISVQTVRDTTGIRPWTPKRWLARPQKALKTTD